MLQRRLGFSPAAARRPLTMPDPLLASYEEFPYQSTPVPASHPDTLATVALLHGLRTRPITEARVLELGCATGGNLVPMAMSLPGSSFVGIDLSPRQIERARDTARALSLGNLRFEAMSITEIGDDFGTFDYVLCHGVYSWVPAEVQQAILRVCARNLAPNGVAYVSYNTYPGWYVRSMVRDMMMFHDDSKLPAPDRVARGRAFLEFLVHSIPGSATLYSGLLNEELETLRQSSDTYFLHEELETVNQPLYFSEFARRAAAHGLQYLDEAQPSAWTTALPESTRARLREWSADEVSFEQYLDFLRNRTFRRTLLCHAASHPNRPAMAEVIPELHLAAHSVPVAEGGSTEAPGAEAFRTPDGITVTMNNRLVLGALHVLLDALPAVLSFDELARRTADRLKSEARAATAGKSGSSDDGEVDRTVLADAMLRCAAIRLVDLHAVRPRCASVLVDRPEASPLARLQAETERFVSNLRHFSVELTPLDRVVLTYCDGTRDRAELAAAVAYAVRQGRLELGVHPPRTTDEYLPIIDASLRRLLGSALLMP